MGNHHRKNEFSHEKWWIFPVRYVKLPEGMNGVFSFFPAQGPSHYFGHIWTISSSAGWNQQPGIPDAEHNTKQHKTRVEALTKNGLPYLAIILIMKLDASICFNMLQYASICFNMLQYASICFNMLQYASICFNMLQYASICFNMLQYASCSFGQKPMPRCGKGDHFLILSANPIPPARFRSARRRTDLMRAECFSNKRNLADETAMDQNQSETINTIFRVINSYSIFWCSPGIQGFNP